MNIKITPNAKEKSADTVNRALKSAIQNDRNVDLSIHGQSFIITPADTYESVVAVKAFAYKLSQLHEVKSKLSA